MSANENQEPSTPDGFFRTTHWSVVLAAREESASGPPQALELLCRAYWYPLYAFVRRRGVPVADAQDLTQEFFARLLQRDFLRNVAREKGKFRTFLLSSLNNFLVSEWHRGQAAKRGGGRQNFVSWDDLQAEERYASEPATENSAEQFYDQRWAVTVMQQAMTQLREEFHSTGRSKLFDQLKPFLSAEGTREDYERAAEPLQMTGGAFSVAVHRLRRRYAEVLRSVVAHTVAGPDEIEEELRCLAQALQG
jgi:RNA polymerase sigma-70 factor (ECF subfamily)